ncbi:MAG: phosphate transport system substrate-binding protein, partial [Thermovirga sp.]|nr:phosphate transport system substrate-binding protein [Thermovirga sp.]
MKKFMASLAVLSMVLVGLLGGTAFAEELVINGSTTVLPIGQAAAEKFME